MSIPPEVVERLDAADDAAAREMLTRCCGAGPWVEGMVARRPFGAPEALAATADEVWFALDEAGWREAFDHHPRIGDVEKLREKFAATADLSEAEQAGVAGASDQVLEDLAQANRDYEARYGHIFLVCATGKTAAEMLEILRGRMTNEPADELRIAAGEQAKITKIRLGKL